MRRAGSKFRGTPGYYEWPAPGRPFSIRLRFDVIDRLEAELRRDVRDAQGRILETGGVLFGRLAPESDALYIEDYQPVKCQHRRGASYTLSEADRKRLVLALRKGQVAGFYRTHTRPGLYLDQDDFAVIERCFSNPHDVFLLVRPNPDGPATGGFFFWEEDTLHRQSTYLEFPFRSSELLPENEVAEPPEELAPVPVPTPAPRRVRRLPLGAMWRATAIAGLALVGTFAAYRLPKPAARSEARAGSDAAPALWVERNGQDLHVSWDRGAPAVRKAKGAMLRITDGKLHRDLRLDRAELTESSVTYAPLGNQVTFRLELDGGGPAVSASFLLQEGAHPPPAPTPVVRAAAVRPPSPRPRRKAWFDDGL